MFDFHEKRKIRALLYSKFVIALLLIPVGFLSFSVYERYQKERETAEKRAERQAELDELNTRASALEAKLHYLESKRGIETEIRDRYDAVKEGEKAIILVGDGERNSPDIPEQEEETSFFRWLKFW